MAHNVLIQPARAVRGTLCVPGDKSVSHRYGLLAALAAGSSQIANYAPGADCTSTLSCMAALGATIAKAPAVEGDPALVHVHGVGADGFRRSPTPLDCGNSGSTMRMLAGVLAGQPFDSVLAGDASLSRRPMRRIMVPLAQMGARLTAAGNRPPLTVHGTALHGIHYTTEVPSAQVKSAVLLAGIQASGRTTVSESAATRDHTERAVVAFGGQVAVDGLDVSVEGGQRLRGQIVRVPGDLSSAVFALIAAAAMPGSEVRIDGVGLNPSRTGVLPLLRRLGAQVEVVVTDEWQGEPVGHVIVRAGAPTCVTIHPAEVPGLIDELPALAAWATFGGELSVTGAAELRVKESDRISSLIEGLRALGADADELPDGFHVRGGTRLIGGSAHARHDHRLAMAFTVAALGASGPSLIEGADVVDVSYPAFFRDLERLRT